MRVWSIFLLVANISSFSCTSEGYHFYHLNQDFSVSNNAKMNHETKEKIGTFEPNVVVIAPPGGGVPYANEVTILVPGIGGDASYWANDGLSSTYHLSDWSLPYLLSNHFGGSVFVYGRGNNNVFGFYSSSDWEGSKFTFLRANQDFDENNVFDFQPKPVSQIACSPNQSIVLFCPDFSMSLSNISSNLPRFYTMMNSLINSNPDIKFNLIGHSRGGLLNMMAASNSIYYSKVQNLVSLGTPYFHNGLALLTDVLEKLGNENAFWDNILGNLDTQRLDAYDDLISSEGLLSIRNNWNLAIQNTSHHINAVAYGFSIVFGLQAPIQGLIWEESGNLLNESIIALEYGISFDTDILVGTKSQFGLGNSDFLTSGGNLLYCDLFSGITDQTYLQGFKRKLYFYDPASLILLNTPAKKMSDPNEPGIPHNAESMNFLALQNICQELEG